MADSAEKIPRAVHVLVRRSGGGTETNVHNLCNAVPEFSYFPLEDRMGFPLRWWRLFSAIGEIKKLKPEVVFCYGLTTHVIAALFLWGVPLVGNIRCESDFVGGKELLRKLIGFRFRTWISNSRIALRGIPGHVVYNGMAIPAEEPALYANYPRPIYGLIGRGHPKKGHRFLIELWRELKPQGTLIFAGELPPELRKEAEKARIICLGHIKPGPLLRSLDMVLLPSEAEGLPTAILEAMVRGIPTLSTPVGGVPELIDNNRTGYIRPREEWRAFFQNIDWEEARAFGGAARVEAFEDFSFDKMRDGFIKVAKEAAGEQD